MKILITGGAGFIGSHLTDRLVKDGHHVTVLDNLATGRRENLSSHLGGDEVELIEGSILDLPFLDKLINENDYVFHLAAAVGVFNIVNHPLDSLKTNIRGTENVLETAHKYAKPVFITSSSEVYGKNVSDSLKETDDRIIGTPVKLRWSYSEAKAIDESLSDSLTPLARDSLALTAWWFHVLFRQHLRMSQLRFMEQVNRPDVLAMFMMLSTPWSV